jgi:hypothetical protein
MTAIDAAEMAEQTTEIVIDCVVDITQDHAAILQLLAVFVVAWFVQV